MVPQENRIWPISTSVTAVSEKTTQDPPPSGMPLSGYIGFGSWGACSCGERGRWLGGTPLRFPARDDPRELARVVSEVVGYLVSVCFS